MSLRIDDVERPDGTHTEYEVVRGPDASGMVVLDPHRGALMIWRHRFMPGTWGWEIPGGAIDPDEDPERAAIRECEEETGWRVTDDVRHLSTHHPSVGLVNQTFHVYLAGGADWVGEPSDRNEAARVEWRPLDVVAADIQSGGISDGFSLLGIALAMATTGRGALLLEPSGD
ncbi:MAG TPA: NUDIX hydrolase [Ilumatobacter sp.]|jgi:8-oxo-dGTP pyrophosphatase MutT (NUDIX family)|nr:NUDIX hydrolase [Ilumatobacter sp.]